MSNDRMDRRQIVTISLFIVLFSVLYFACDTKTNKEKALEKSRVQNLEILNIDRVRAEASQNLSGPGKLILNQLVDSLNTSSVDEERLTIMEKLASFWYNQERPLISAYYAEKIAEINNTDESWQISGTSYLIAAQRLQDERSKKYAIQKSRMALEKSLSFNPESIDNRINLALSYVEAPIEENPMKGILMLLDLNKEYPDNTAILIQLGRLAMGTNQLDKAVERLTRVVELEPSNRQAHCYLEEIYTKQGKMDDAERERKYCEIK